MAAPCAHCQDQEIPELVPCRGHPGAEEQTGPVTGGDIGGPVMPPQPGLSLSQGQEPCGDPKSLSQPHSRGAPWHRWVPAPPRVARDNSLSPWNVPSQGQGVPNHSPPFPDGWSILTLWLSDPIPAVAAGISQSWLHPGTPLGIPSSLPDGFLSPPHVPRTSDSSGLGKSQENNKIKPGDILFVTTMLLSLLHPGVPKPPMSPRCLG